MKAASLKRTGEYTHARCRCLVFPQCEAGQARPAAGEKPADQLYSREKGKAQEEEGRSPEPCPEKDHPRDSADPQCPAEKGDVKEHGDHDEVDPDCGDGEEVFLQPETGQAEDKADEPRYEKDKRQGAPEGKTPGSRQEGGRVGADPEESGVAEGNLSRIADNDVQAAGHDGLDRYEGSNRDRVVAHCGFVLPSACRPGVPVDARAVPRSWR